MALSDFNTSLPLPDIFPKQWRDKFDSGFRHFAFRNLDHFKHEMSLIKQQEDNKCGVTYAQALSDLLQGKSDFPESEQESIRNLVRSNLHKRGLITQEVYEAFRYSTDGTQVDVDVGKYTAGEADCVITPSRQYIDFFYELYISISYPYHVSNETVRENVAKLLATIEELERQHIFIKIMLVFPDIDAGSGDRPNLFCSIPLFSHKDPKSVATMSAVVNERLLRKFMFALLENEFGKDLRSNYGIATDLATAMNIGSRFDEIEFFEKVHKIATGE